MKKSFLYIIAIVMLLAAQSCTDWLDLKPEAEIVLDEYWQSETDVESMLASCYRSLTEPAVISRMIVWGELRSDNLTSGFSTGYDLQRILDGDILPTNSYASWGAFYTTINYCNTLLYYAPLVLERDNNFTQADLNRVKAEALAIRSLAYFYLVRTFRDVPYIVTPSIDDAQDYNVPKTEGKVIIQKLIEDLKTAKMYARVDFGNKKHNKGRFTQSSVSALLADIYLWDKQYDKCIEECDNVLTNSKLSMVDGSIKLSLVYYVGNSDESIFELQFDEQGMRNTTVMNFYGMMGDIAGELAFPATRAYDDEATQLFRGAYSPFAYPKTTTLIESSNDIRAKESYNLQTGSGGIYYITKYACMSRSVSSTSKSSYNYSSTTANWIVYRLPEIYLMKAEALVELEGENNFRDAIKLVNKTYLRSNEGSDSLYIANYSTKTTLRELVFREKQREFLFEGKRWFDLVRLSERDGNTSALNLLVEQKTSNTNAVVGAQVLDAMYMPISKWELSANPNLKQNPYYQEENSTSTR